MLPAARIVPTFTLSHHQTKDIHRQHERGEPSLSIKYKKDTRSSHVDRWPNSQREGAAFACQKWERLLPPFVRSSVRPFVREMYHYFELIIEALFMPPVALRERLDKVARSLKRC